MYWKFFASAFTGSMMGAGADVFAVWAYAIANADVRGFVELNPKLLGAVIGAKPEAMATAIRKLTDPDPESRTEQEEGRRMVKEGSFIYRIVNYQAYRAMRDQDERREQQRVAARDKRAKPLDAVGQGRPEPAYGEVEGKEEGKEGRSDPPHSPGAATPSEPAPGYSDPATPHGLIAAIRRAVEREHPEIGFYAPGQWAAKAAREFIEAIPPERRTDDLREEIRRRVEAFARTTDKRITKGRWLVEAFCEGYNQLADAGGAGDLELAASRLAGRKVGGGR